MSMQVYGERIKLSDGVGEAHRMQSGVMPPFVVSAWLALQPLRKWSNEMRNWNGTTLSVSAFCVSSFSGGRCVLMATQKARPCEVKWKYEGVGDCRKRQVREDERKENPNEALRLCL
jgi:hypothetical protein